MPVSPTTVFISAATVDLEEWRDVLHHAFSRAGFHVVTQNHSLGAATGVVRRHLVDHVNQCDCVIHLAGMGYGSHAQAPFPFDSSFQCSWTQFEYYYAHSIGKDVIGLVCSPNLSSQGYEEEGSLQEIELKQRLQCEHRHRVESGVFEGTPLVDMVERTSNEGVSTQQSLLTSVAAAVGTLHGADPAFERLKRELLDLQDSLSSISNSVQEVHAEISRNSVVVDSGIRNQDAHLKLIQKGVKDLVDSDEERKASVLKRLSLKLGFTTMLGALVIGIIDIFLNGGELGEWQFCIALASSLGIALLAYRRNYIVALSTVLLLLSLGFISCLEPLVGKSEFYLSLSNTGGDWSWEEESVDIYDKTVNVVVIRDPLRCLMTPYIADAFGIDYRVIPITMINGAYYAEMELKGKLEGQYLDGVTSWSSLVLECPATCFHFGYDRNKTGFSGSRSYFTKSEFVEVNKPVGYSMVGWENVRLPSEPEDHAKTLLYTAVLNESLEALMRGERDVGLRSLAILLDNSSAITKLRPPTTMESARVLAIQSSLSELLWGSMLGRIHSLSMLGPTYDLLIRHVTAQDYVGNEVASLWILDRLLRSYEGFRIDSRVENLAEIRNEIAVSSEKWSRVGKDPYLEQMFGVVGDFNDDVAEFLQSSFKRTPQSKTHFNRLESFWQTLTDAEIEKIGKSGELTESEFRVFLGHLATRGMMKTLADSSSILKGGANQGRGSNTLFYEILEKTPHLLPPREKELLLEFMRFQEGMASLHRGEDDHNPIELYAASKNFGSPFFRKMILNIDSDLRYSESDLDFSGAWWQESFLESFTNLLIVVDLPIIPLDTKELQKHSLHIELLEKLERAHRDPSLLDFFSRDRAGTGLINLPWLVYWQCVAEGHAMKSADDLNQICKDLTRQAFGDGNEFSAVDLRRAFTVKTSNIPMSLPESKLPWDLKFTGITEKLQKALTEFFCDNLDRATVSLLPKMNTDDLELELKKELHQFFKNKGYLSCSEPIVGLVPNASAKPTLKILVEDTGQRFTIEATHHTGSGARFRPEVEKICKELDGKFYGADIMKNTRLAIRRFYRKKGFLDCSVTPMMKVSSSTSVQIGFSLTEGGEVRLGNFNFYGPLPWGREKLEEMTSNQSGEVIDGNELDSWKDDIIDLYQLNGFSGYQVQIRESPGGGKGLRNVDVYIRSGGGR